MRTHSSLLIFLLGALLLAGCTTADAISFDRLLEDFGVKAETLQMLRQAGVDLPDTSQPVIDLPEGVSTEVENFLEDLRSFRLQIPSWFRAVLIVAGVALLAAGGKLYKATVAAPGFALGMVIGTSVLNLAKEIPQLVVVGVAAIIGLVGGGLALYVHNAALVLIGSVVGGYLGFSLLTTYAVQFSAAFLPIVLLCVVAGGIGLLLLSHRIQPLIGAILGAVLISLGLVENMSLVIIVPLAVIGVSLQGVLKWRKHLPKLSQAPPPSEPAAPMPQQQAPPYAPPAQTPQPKPQPIRAEAVVAMLVRQSETGERQKIIGAANFHVGSDPTICHLVLPGTAGLHVTIMSGVRNDTPYYHLQNHADAYETLVNGQPTQSIYLNDQDIIQVGEHSLQFKLRL